MGNPKSPCARRECLRARKRTAKRQVRQLKVKLIDDLKTFTVNRGGRSRKDLGSMIQGKKLLEKAADSAHST